MGTDADVLHALPAVSVVGLVADHPDHVLRQLADRAVSAGLVEATFPDAVVAREIRYPTGLPSIVPVAIPHADPGHVRSGGFAVATLARPVAFGVMGTVDQFVDVDLVVMLLLVQAHQQVDVLTRLIAVFQTEGWDLSLRAAGTAAELAQAFDALLESGTMER